ncbi:MAG: uncharacterized protein QG670_2242 [Thermoproteota archaeon]|nr:uncharacterized protein [Thermoproteota archaeon]
MTIPCELAVKSIIPAFRALVAKELVESYQLKQENVAGLLGITQAAVSQYTRSVRGRALNLDDIEEIGRIVKELAVALTMNTLTLKQINQRYCEVCRIAREARIVCDLHKRLDPEFNIDECNACIPDYCSGSFNQERRG